ncbi:MAG: RNA polymerase sigma factor [Bacteroidales bacterium]|nr:RNA polymerase sigma factor [Bacteroidales bacterium]
MTREEFKNIFDTHFTIVRNYIYYRCGNTDLATDVAQETFLKLWEKQESFKNNNVKGLLFKMSNDLFISHYRKQKTIQNYRLQLKTEYVQQSPEDLLQFDELQKSYDNLLRVMPEKQRVVFLMHRMDELKYHEMADRLGLSVKAVEKRMKMAIEFIRKNLNN